MESRRLVRMHSLGSRFSNLRHSTPFFVQSFTPTYESREASECTYSKDATDGESTGIHCLRVGLERFYSSEPLTPISPRPLHPQSPSPTAFASPLSAPTTSYTPGSSHKSPHGNNHTRNYTANSKSKASRTRPGRRFVRALQDPQTQKWQRGGRGG